MKIRSGPLDILVKVGIFINIIVIGLLLWYYFS